MKNPINIFAHVSLILLVAEGSLGWWLEYFWLNYILSKYNAPSKPKYFWDLSD